MRGGRRGMRDGEAGEEAIGEMARLATLAIRVKRFLSYTASAYAFYIYAIGVLSFLFLGLSTASMTGVPEGLAANVGAFTGITVSTYVVYRILAKITSTIGGEKPGFTRHGILVLAAAVLAAIVIVYLVAEVSPESEGVLWHPMVAIFLLAFYAANPLPYTRPHLIAAVIMLASDPLVLAYPESRLDIGTFTLAYFIAGLYSLWRGLEELGG